MQRTQDKKQTKKTKQNKKTFGAKPVTEFSFQRSSGVIFARRKNNRWMAHFDDVSRS